MRNVTKEKVIYLQYLFTVLKEEETYFPQPNRISTVSVKQSLPVSLTDLTFISQLEKVYDSSVNMSGSPCWQKSQGSKFKEQTLWSIGLCCNSRWGPPLGPQHCRPPLPSSDTLH